MEHYRIKLSAIILITIMSLTSAATTAFAKADNRLKSELESGGKQTHKKKKDDNPTRKDVADSLDIRVQPFKKYLSEFTMFGGNYLGDKWGNTWDVGGIYTFYFNDTFGFSGNYLFSQISADSSSTFGQNLRTKDQHATYGAFILNNDTAFRAGDSIVQCDLFMTIGGGATRINYIWKPLLVIGGGLRVYTPIPWFAVRFDVNSLMHPTPHPGGSSFNSDLTMNIGFSFLIPPRKLMPDHSSESVEGK